MGSPSDLGTQQGITAEYFGLHASGRDDTTGSAPKAIERRDTTKNHMSIAFDDGITQHAIPRHWALKVLREKHRLPCYSMRKPRGVGFDWPDDPADPSATRFASAVTAGEQKYREEMEQWHGAIPEPGLESLQPGDRVEVWRKVDSVGGLWMHAKFGGPSRNRPGRYTVQMYYSPRFGEWLREEELPTV